MKKKQYLAPAMQQVDVELQTILATSAPVIKGTTEGGGDLEFGGETDPGKTYNPS